MNEVLIERVTIPSAIDVPDAADFVGMIELGNRIEADALGTDRDIDTPREQLPWWHSPDEPKHAIIARLDGLIVGRGLAELTDDPDSPAAWLTVEVDRDFRGRGIGAALFDAVTALVPEKPVQQVYLLHGADGGERIPSPTGFGSVPLDHPGTRFLLARGFSLGQVVRVSSLRLPVEVQAAFADASAAAGPDYAVHLWSGPAPERWLEGLAIARSRMATDAPWAGIEPDSGRWTADRVREADAREATGGRIRLTAIVEHLPSGRLAAYNELSVPPEKRRSVTQYDTLVLADHRGHRLGMLVKSANLLALQREHPGHPAVGTYNAEENRHMLSVNEALGFVPIGYEGAWRRDL